MFVIGLQFAQIQNLELRISKINVNYNINMYFLVICIYYFTGNVTKILMIKSQIFFNKHTFYLASIIALYRC